MAADSTLKRVSVSEDEDELLDDGGAADAVASPQPRTLSGLRIEGKTFTELQDFSLVTFNGPVVFKSVRFAAGCKFDGSVFKSRVNFSGVQVSGTSGCLSSFVGCQFGAIARFDKSTLYLANFTTARFHGPAFFKATRFNASAHFDDVEFAQTANFAGAVFNGSGNFNRTKFGATAEFAEAEFRYWLSHARFNHASFTELASFNDAQFSGNAEFKEARFKAGVTFSDARFAENVEEDAVGNGTATQEVARSSANRADLTIDFSNASFSPSAEGELASFEGVKLGDRNFTRDARLDGAVFHAGNGSASTSEPLAVDFKGLDCAGGLSLRDAKFSPGVDADFRGAKLEHDLDLTGTWFGSAACFEKAQFRQGMILGATRFDLVPDFRQATFTHRPELHEAKLPSKPTTHSKGQRAVVLQCIRTLKRLAEQSEDKRTANAMLVHELKLEGGVASRMYGLISGYGQSWLRPAVWLVVLAVLVFPMVHLAIYGRIPTSPEEFQAAALNLGPPCAAKGDGNALAAALELSIKNAMVVATDNEARLKRTAECLGGADKAGFVPVAAAALEALQIVLSAILVFFVGASVRRRLQVR